jgi:hypothetical protein
MAATDRNTVSARNRGRIICGFCGPAGQPVGFCRDADGHCRGTWPGFLPATRGNPEGFWTCACSARGHPGRPADAPATCAA